MYKSFTFKAFGSVSFLNDACERSTFPSVILTVLSVFASASNARAFPAEYFGSRPKRTRILSINRRKASKILCAAERFSFAKPFTVSGSFSISIARSAHSSSFAPFSLSSMPAASYSACLLRSHVFNASFPYVSAYRPTIKSRKASNAPVFACTKKWIIS